MEKWCKQRVYVILERERERGREGQERERARERARAREREIETERCEQTVCQQACQHVQHILTSTREW